MNNIIKCDDWNGKLAAVDGRDRGWWRGTGANRCGCSGCWTTPDTSGKRRADSGSAPSSIRNKSAKWSSISPVCPTHSTMQFNFNSFEFVQIPFYSLLYKLFKFIQIYFNWNSVKFIQILIHSNLFKFILLLFNSSNFI